MGARFTPHRAPFAGREPDGATADPAAAQRTRFVAASQTRRAEIEIVTAEGDRVTLSASYTRAFAASQTTTGEGRTTAAVTRTSQQLQVTVDGDLSQDELEDIAKVLELLRKASRRHGGRDPERMAGRLAHAHLDTLGQVSATFTTATVRQRFVAVEPPPVPPVVEQPALATT